MKTLDGLVTVKTAAIKLGIARQNVWLRIGRGTLEAIEVDGRTYVDATSLKRAVKEQKDARINRERRNSPRRAVK